MILNKIDQCGGMGSTCYMSLNLFQTCLVLKSFFNNLSLHFRSTWLKKDKKIKTYAFLDHEKEKDRTKQHFMENMTGLQPVSRTVDQVPLLMGFDAKSFWCQGLAKRQSDRQTGLVAGGCKVFRHTG